MKKEVADKMFKEDGIKYIPQYKKIWLSITKFERYPEMAAEGVGRALGYLSLLIFIFAIILVAGLTYKLGTIINQSINYLDENISVIDYKDGILNVELESGEKEIRTDEGTIIIDTGDVSDEQLTEYKNSISSNSLGIICLKDYAVVDFNNDQENYYYQDILSDLDVSEFNKSDLLGLLNDTLVSPKAYVVYYLIMIIYVFIAYFISALFNVLLLSIFGVLTALIAKMKMRYRAVFNMSVYAITISTILQLIYLMINLFTDFEIKYFDLMYSAISYICLTAAIFMIKSDVIKQQIEMIKIKQNKEQEVKNTEDERQEENKEEDKEEESKEENDKENETQDDKKSDEEKSEKDNKEIGNEAEGQV